MKDLLRQVVRDMAYGKVDKNFYTNNRELLNNANYVTVRMAYVFSAFMCFFLFIITCWSESVSTLNRFYLGFTIIFTAMATLVLTVFRRKPRYMRGLYYLFAAIMFGITIYVGTARSPQNFAVMFFVLLMILPLLYMEPPIYSMLMSATACIIFCYTTARLKAAYPQIVIIDTLNAICCFVISIGFISYTRNIRLDNIQAAVLFRAQSETDELTGITNKASTESRCKLYLDHIKDGVSCAMVVIDLDNFKTINDTLGHNQGDIFLQKVGDILRHIFRESDIVGRIGGDEFLVLMKNISDRKIIAKKAERVTKRIGEIFQELTTQKFTCSIGISIRYPKQQLSYQTLFFQADRALYHVKHNKKDDFEFYSEACVVLEEKPLLMVVDNTEVNRAILRSYLEEEYSILEAENGQEALAYMERYFGMIAAILLDMDLPVMNGYEILNIVKADETLCKIPILVIADHEKMERRALELGTVGLITKPFDPLVVKKRVKNAALEVAGG